MQRRLLNGRRGLMRAMIDDAKENTKEARADDIRGMLSAAAGRSFVRRQQRVIASADARRRRESEQRDADTAASIAAKRARGDFDEYDAPMPAMKKIRPANSENRRA